MVLMDKPQAFIIPSNPTVLNPDSDDTILVRFNSQEDIRQAMWMLFGSSIHDNISSRFKTEIFYLNKPMLEKLEEITTIKYRVISPSRELL